MRSLDFKFPGIGTVTSSSESVWVHLYGRSDCSCSSLARSSTSFLARSEGVGDDGRSVILAEWSVNRGRQRN